MSRRDLGGYLVGAFALSSSLACSGAPDDTLMDEPASLSGSSSSAGAPGITGAAAGAGGVPSSRSAAPGKGGTGATSTSSEGGAASGGRPSTRPVSSAGAGGAARAGEGGAPQAASAGAADSNEVTASSSGRSAGCGSSKSGNGEFVERTLSVLGRDRSYHVMVPETYDANRAYPVVFRFHGTGGDGTSGGLGIEFVSREDAIVVGPDGLDARWSNQNQENDLAFFDAMLDTLEGEYCIDEDRVFAYGFSAGGGFTNLLGCERADVIRATAAVASYDRGSNCRGGVAAWFHHDASDDSVGIDRGVSARDRVLERNHCSTESVAEGERCVRYQGCDAGTPVVWCESSGQGHNIAADFAPTAVWSFFTSLP